MTNLHCVPTEVKPKLKWSIVDVEVAI